MNYLLDTHAFLWTASKSEQLPDKISQIIKNKNNEIFVSAVTFWEISIKYRIEKLDLDGLLPEDFTPIAEEMELQFINLTPEEAIKYGRLKENTHKDPFDRMLIWQAISRNLIMISKDTEFDKFKTDGLRLIW